MRRFLPVIYLVIAFAVVMLYIRPTYANQITALRTQLASYDSALEAAAHFQEREAELTKQRAQIPSDSLARLQAFLPDGVDNVQLILDMDALAARSGMTLSDFNIAAGGAAADDQPGGDSLQSSSPVESLTLSFKAVGTYAAFRTFLTAMENSLRPLDVTGVQIDKSATGVYSYSVAVRIYWLQ